MGPRSAETPPPYSSAPPRPPDLDEVRRKRIQIAREQAAEQAAVWRREFEKTIASFRSELLNELRQFRSELTAQVMEPSRPTSAGPVRSLPVTQPVSSELHFGTIDSYKPPPPLPATADLPPPATAGLYPYQLQQPPPPPPRPSITVHALAESPSPVHMRYTYHSLSNGDFNKNRNQKQQHFSLNDDCGALSPVSVAKLTGIDEKLDMGEGESLDTIAEVNSGDGRVFNQLESVTIKQDDQGPTLCGKIMEYHSLYMFDKMLQSDGMCNAGRTIIVPMSIRDKGGGLTTHREVVDASDEMAICSVSAKQDDDGFVEGKKQVPKLSVEALMVSVIPGDVGKPTVKLDKVVVRDGSCRWENLVYETVKFDREPRTGKSKERLYSFVLSTGSSKASVLGEISVDFAEYSEATKASSVSLPLKNSSAVLHVSIQKLQANADQREVEDCEDAKVKSQDNSLKRHLSNNDADESVLVDETINRTTQNAECNRTASIGSDITLSSSDSSSGLDTSRELVLRNINNCHDPSNYLSSPNQPSIPHRPGVYGSTNNEQQQSQWEWSADSEHGVSSDGSTKSSQDNLLRERSLQSSGDDIDKLKAELVVLSRQADMSELELQTLRKQIVKESKRGHDLSREVVSLKEERDAFKAECEKLKAFQYRMDDTKTKNRFQLEGGDLRALVDEIRQELSCEKDLNSNLRLQLQKTQESNAELILAVRDLEEILEQKNGEAANSNRSESTNDAAGSRATNSNDVETEDEEQKELEDLVKEHSHAKDTHLLEKQITDLYNELEIYKRDKDELEMQMEQLALDYEILKQENHDISYKLEQSTLQEQLKMQYECSSPTASVNELHYQIEDLETELKKQAEDFSNSLATIKELQSHIKSMEEELEKQAQGFEADLETVTCAKVEQEQRAIQAEEALRKTRLKNANTAERLQEEFRRLSSQMASTFDANEKVAMKAMTEASELGAQKSHLEELLKKTKEELQASREEYEAKLQKLSNELDEKTREMEQMLLEIQNKSMQLEDQQKQEGDFSEVILQLKAEIERLTRKNNSLSEEVEQNKILSAELEKMKKSIEENEMLIQRGNVERNEFVSTIDMLKKEAEKSLEKLNKMKYLMDEKEATIRRLQLESDKLKAQCNDLKRTLSEDEVEKGSLKRQVFDLKADLKKKEDALTTTEKKLKDSNGRTIVSDGAKHNLRNNKSLPVPRATKEVASLRERIKLLEGQIKLKEAALERSTASFLEKEMDLQNVIEELENRVEEINQNCAFEQDITSKDNMLEEVRRVSDNLSTELASLKERNMSMESELKEMQERYSEISLKFAEVEGERQQLVMTVRNLKNSKRS